MSPDFNQTEREREVLDSARRLLGPNLADYLLSGLGEAEVKANRAFIAQGIPLDDESTPYRFEILSESAKGLPAGRDPLVLSALLVMFREQQLMDDTVCFNVGDVLKRLGWPSTAEAELLVNQAVNKYLWTAYLSVDQGIPKGEYNDRFYPHFGRLLIEYEISETVLIGVNMWPRSYVRVKLPPAFINALSSGRKRFLGVDFQGLGEMREITC